ncbi:hypothetical protein [Flagellimonas alvinocaridis]|uniref:hypothetical protein n=1 Tax=Flagellimonas alvinocaridis TaxID=2530200 RepID=UPI0013757140|nr:hypothetical protein [Allomuricauda alvinocaridis]
MKTLAKRFFTKPNPTTFREMPLAMVHTLAFYAFTLSLFLLFLELFKHFTLC